jgi:glutamate racemase
VTDLRPIGIFDSGIGGLTVLAALQRRLPGECYIYLGDTARLPYGTKSAETVVRYALRAAEFLADHGVKMLVVACNTASAAALPALEEAMTIPVVGVVAPGARAAVARTSGSVGIIGTESTVASGAYLRAVHALRPEVEVLARACPLFVPLAEEGWWDHPVTEEVARLYLEPFGGGRVDTLILGCTHYPLLRHAIARAVGPGVGLVDSAEAVAGEVAEALSRGTPTPPAAGSLRLLVTDAAARITRIARLILPEVALNLELVDLPD